MDRERRILSRAEILEWVDKVFIIPNNQRNFTEREISLSLGKSASYLKQIYLRDYGITELMQVRFSKVIFQYGEPRQTALHNRRIVSKVPQECYIKMAKAMSNLSWVEKDLLDIDTYTFRVCKNNGVPKFYKKTFRRLYRRLTGEPFIY